MATAYKTENRSLTDFSETLIRGTVCGKSARTGLWGSGKVTTHSTRRQQKDNEIYGEGNAYTAMFWEYDARLGRRWNVDPILNPNQSPFTTLDNSPIITIDPLGLYGRKSKAERMRRRAKRQGWETSFVYQKDGEYVFNIKKKVAGYQYYIKHGVSEGRDFSIYLTKDYLYESALPSGIWDIFHNNNLRNNLAIKDDLNNLDNINDYQSRPVEFVSQYDKKIPGAGGKACYSTCVYMSIKSGVNPIPGMANGYFVAKEFGKRIVPLPDISNGFNYMDEQLKKGNPVIVGVARNADGYWGRNYNGDGTTDHFVLVIAKRLGAYQFYDPGAYPYQKEKGTNPNNLFFKNPIGTFTGKSYGFPMTVSWIGKNK